MGVELKQDVEMKDEPEQEENQDWLEMELSEVSLGDKRLNWRLIDTGKKLAARPSGSINQACDDWADTKASYRLFNNEKTTAEKILLPHQERTKERIAGHERVLAIQDSSYLNYSHHPAKKGMGPIGTTEQNITGMVMHTTLITTCAGLPLGVAGQEIWSRPEEAKQMSPNERRKLPIKEKESNKWLKGLDQAKKVTPDGTKVVNVCDAEADIFELFNHARTLETDILIRAAQDRSVCEPEVGRLWTILGERKIAGHLKVQVPARDNEPKRTAIVAVRHTPVTLRTPQHLRKNMDDISLYGILVQEVDPPDDVKNPLCWLLLTTIPVLSFDDALERVQWYRQRWQIEVYHKVLKSGCHVERSQLADSQALIPFIALLSIIAWRLFWLTHIRRHDPDAPCTLVLTTPEWQSLYAFHHRTSLLPSEVPTVAQATLWIAQLGGFLNRKHDGQPGVTVLWRGWQRLSDISAAWSIFLPP